MTELVLPTSVLALDLSLAATGVWCGDPYAPGTICVRTEIRTPERRKGERDLEWNAHRCRTFIQRLVELVAKLAPEVVVIEVTSHAHQVMTRGRGTPDARRERTTRGVEFRAGLGLGRALGWIDSLLMVQQPAFTLIGTRFETIEAKDVKLRVAGAQAASKAAVAATLREIWGWDTTGWRESEIDALACAVAYVRALELDAKERALRGLALAEDAARLGRTPQPLSLRKRQTGAPAR